MNDHAELLELLHTIKESSEEAVKLVRIQNGRVRALEVAVAVLKYAVFVGGAGVCGALGYLISIHVTK
jgi:hypothetical protein